MNYIIPFDGTDSCTLLLPTARTTHMGAATSQLTFFTMACIRFSGIPHSPKPPTRLPGAHQSHNTAISAQIRFCAFICPFLHRMVSQPIECMTYEPTYMLWPSLRSCSAA